MSLRKTGGIAHSGRHKSVTAENPNKPTPEAPPTTVQLQAVSRPQRCETTRMRERDWIDKATFWLQVLGLFILVVYAVATIAIWRANKKAADAATSAANTARDTLVASSRAWIAPNTASFTSKIAEHVPMSWGVQYSNTGKSPALDVHPIWSLQQVPVSKFEDNTFNAFIEADKASDACTHLGTAPGADVVYPDQPNGYKLIFTNHQPEWVNSDVLSGNTAVVLQMCFAYKTMGEVHHTSFCYFYRAGVSPTNNQMNICTAGNHAD
jgi:hypothetical protein